MTTAQLIKNQMDRIPVDWTGHRDMEILVRLTDRAEMKSARTETLNNGIRFNFFDGSALTYNAQAERAEL